MLKSSDYYTCDLLSIELSLKEKYSLKQRLTIISLECPNGFLKTWVKIPSFPEVPKKHALTYRSQNIEEQPFLITTIRVFQLWKHIFPSVEEQCSKYSPPCWLPCCMDSESLGQQTDSPLPCSLSWYLAYSPFLELPHHSWVWTMRKIQPIIVCLFWGRLLAVFENKFRALLVSSCNCTTPPHI